MDQDIFRAAVAEERRLISKGNNVREDFVRDYCCREMIRREEQEGQKIIRKEKQNSYGYRLFLGRSG